MQKLLTGLVTATAIVTLASAAQAACSGHSVTASSEQAQESVAISTYDGAAPAPVEEADKAAEVDTTACADGETDCSEDGTE